VAVVGFDPVQVPLHQISTAQLPRTHGGMRFDDGDPDDAGLLGTHSARGTRERAERSHQGYDVGQNQRGGMPSRISPARSKAFRCASSATSAVKGDARKLRTMT